MWEIGNCNDYFYKVCPNINAIHTYNKTCCLVPGAYSLTWSKVWTRRKREVERTASGNKKSLVSFVIQGKKYCEDIDHENSSATKNDCGPVGIKGKITIIWILFRENSICQ